MPGLIVAFRLAGLLNLNVKGLPIYRTLFYLPSIASGVGDGRGVSCGFFQPSGLFNSFLGIFGIKGWKVACQYVLGLTGFDYYELVGGGRRHDHFSGRFTGDSSKPI